MSKFNSWFRERETKLSNSKSKEPGSLPGDEQDPTSADHPPGQVGKVVQVLNQVMNKLPDREKPLYLRRWLWLSVGVGGSAIALTTTWWWLGQGLPETRELSTIIRQDTLTIKAGDGTILQQQGPATREQLQLPQIPKLLQQAFIASEDRRFYQHNGVDAQGVVRAALSNVRSRGVRQGGSTITQQLARILFLKQEKSIWRKLKEARLAQKIEDELSKNQILERYLNLVYLGSGAYGVGDAAWVYFSKTVDQLTLPEMATIAGLAPAPSTYDPTKNPEDAKIRRNLVLQRMQEDKIITPAQKKAAVDTPLILKASLPKRLEVKAPYFTTFIKKELPKYISTEAIEAGGLTIETSLNPTWQQAAEEAVEKTLKQEGRWQNFKQAALVTIDPQTGEIKAMVGGRDFGKYQFNRVTQAKRQPGSTFKGIVYAAAIATGMNPTNGYLDAPMVVDGYEPKNYTEEYKGWLNMRDALTSSINVIAVKVLIDVGFQPTIKLAQDMGIKSELKPTYSLALGSSEVNLLELTSAYGTFATQGMHAEAHGVRRILNRKGDVLWSADYKPKRALDADSAAIMTWMLRKVVDDGTGRPAQLDRPVAGKTGTTDEYRDLWFIGYVPQLVTGVWLGNDDNKPTYSNSGTAAQTWHKFMEQAVKDLPEAKFPERPDLEGRKGSIKAEPIKPRRLVNRPVPAKDGDDNNTQRSNDGNDTAVTRRRVRVTESNISGDNERPRRRRRRRSDDDSSSSSSSSSSSLRRRSSDDETPRVRRRRSRSDSSTSSSSSSSNSDTPRRSRRRRSSESTSSSNSNTPRRSRRRSSDSGASNSSGSSRPRVSWRDRLRPDGSLGN